MYITTPTKCSFEYFVKGKGLWSRVVEHPDEFMLLSQRRVDSYVWMRFLFDTPKGRISNSTYAVYNPYLVWGKDADTFDDLFNTSAPQQRTQLTTHNMCTENVKDDDDDAREFKKNIKTALETMQDYFIFMRRILHEALVDPTHMYEMFQKSIIYEVLFYNMRYKTGQDETLSRFLLGITDAYLGFSMTGIEKSKKKYCAKQYVAIIPRGHGKTRIQAVIIAVALVTLPDVKILAMAHTRNLICTTKDDVENILNKAFPASKLRYKTSRPEDNLILTFEGVNNTTSSRLEYASACKSSTIRGHDPDIGLCDEALSVSPQAHTTINALSQRTHTKIGLLSSPLCNKYHLLLNFIRRLEGSENTDINMYRVSYFCFNDKHVQYSTSQMGCYRRMCVPRHIQFSKDNKLMDGIMASTDPTVSASDTSAFENELGVVRREDVERNENDGENDNNSGVRVFTDTFIEHLRDSFTHMLLENVPGSAYWIYIDPAYHPTRQSAICIVCVKFQNETGRALLCYTDRKLVAQSDLGVVSSVIEEMYTHCIRTVVSFHRPLGEKCYFFVAIERNSNPDSVRAYYKTWVDLRRRIPPPTKTDPQKIARKAVSEGSSLSEETIVNLIHACAEFFFYAETTSAGLTYYGYSVTSDKRSIFSGVANILNRKHTTYFRIALTNEMGWFMSDCCSLEYLLREVRQFRYKNRRFTGKVASDACDDAITCLVMCLFMGDAYKLSINERIDNFEKNKRCSLPWVNGTTVFGNQKIGRR